MRQKKSLNHDDFETKDGKKDAFERKKTKIDQKMQQNTTKGQKEMILRGKKRPQKGHFETKTAKQIN